MDTRTTVSSGERRHGSARNGRGVGNAREGRELRLCRSEESEALLASLEGTGVREGVWASPFATAGNKTAPSRPRGADRVLWARSFGASGGKARAR